MNESTPQAADPAALYQQFVAHYRDGRLEEAWRLGEAYAARAAHTESSLHALGSLALATGRVAEALTLLQRAVAMNARDATFQTALGNAQLAAGDYQGALSSYERALTIAPDFAEAHFNRGNAQFDQGEFSAAIGSFRAAVTHDPSSYGAYNNMGLAFFCLKQFDRALACYEASLAIAPGDPWALIYRGDALRDSGRVLAAVESYDRALAIDPSLFEASNGRGSALAQLRRFEEALASYNAAITGRSDFAEAYFNRGQVLQQLGRFELARDSFRQALALRRNFAEAYYKLGDLERELGHPERAAPLYDQALELNPALPYLRGTRLHCRMQLCDWQGFDEELKRIEGEIGRGAPVCPPFALLGFSGSPAVQRQVAEIYVQREALSERKRPRASPSAREKIRVGFFSADFKNHPIANLCTPLIEAVDRRRFELVGFSYGQDTQDAMRLRSERAFDQFLDLRTWSDDAIAERARAEAIDIAIDLGGFTSGARPGIFAARASPVQIGYLGYMATSAAPFMDFLIADEVLVPLALRAQVTERVIYLPFFQASDPKRQLSEGGLTRADVGLPEQAFVYCCFNAPYKITPAQFRVWLRILSKVSNSVLWLNGANELVVQNLRRTATQAGIGGERLIFATSVPWGGYFARYPLADLFLDTFPYNAGTTASDALWAGLPLLTCAGEAMCSRMAASILTACRLPQLITETPQAYEGRAVELAARPDWLAAMRRRLTAERASLPAFDIQRIANSFESTLEAVHQRAQSGAGPEDVRVS